MNDKQVRQEVRENGMLHTMKHRSPIPENVIPVN